MAVKSDLVIIDKEEPEDTAPANAFQEEPLDIFNTVEEPEVSYQNLFVEADGAVDCTGTPAINWPLSWDIELGKTKSVLAEVPFSTGLKVFL